MRIATSRAAQGNGRAEDRSPTPRVRLSVPSDLHLIDAGPLSFMRQDSTDFIASLREMARDLRSKDGRRHVCWKVNCGIFTALLVPLKTFHSRPYLVARQCLTWKTRIESQFLFRIVDDHRKIHELASVKQTKQIVNNSV